MKRHIQDRLLELLAAAARDAFAGQIPEEALRVDLPTDVRFGDVTTNIALQASRVLKANPRQIAQELSVSLRKRIDESDLKRYIQDIKIEGAGFINFYFARPYFQELLKEILIDKEEAFKVDFGRGEKALIEFVSANPTGPLSVAHARQAAVGDALAKVLDFMGFAVSREYYLNDEGNQINILGNSVRLRLQELLGETVVFPEDHYQGDYIYDMARTLKEKGAQGIDFAEYSSAYILDIIRKELDDFGVAFDYWYSQKSLRTSGKIQQAFDLLTEKGFLYPQDGATWLKSTAFGDDKDRVVIKSDGSYTYLAPDIAYHRDKFARGFSLLINLWGPDHHGYINRLKAAVEAQGFDPKGVQILIVQLATIFRDGKPVQMSTRRGQYITLREVLDEVGKDAARFFFLMRRTSSHLDFDLEVAKRRNSENPVYYVQYAHARISSILRSAQSSGNLAECDAALLREPEEIELIKKLGQFTYVLQVCVHTLDPYMVTVYLQEVAERFHRFYDRHRVLGQESGLTLARLALLEAAQTVLRTGLGLLGVSSPDKM